MNNVISLESFRDKKVTNPYGLEPNGYVPPLKSDDTLTLIERIERIKNSIDRINTLMMELKELSKER